jgi:RNA polymerase sigma-70 factor, ECF subfamily
MLMEAAATVAAPAELSPETLGELFEEHARAIYNYCFRRTADWALAEDLTSAVFLEAWRRRKDVDLVGEPPLPWLYGVATNLLRNHRRSLRRFRSALERVPPPVPTPDFAEETAERLDDERRMREVLADVERLPRGQQEVLALCVWAGLEYEEAARALDVPVGTVRSRLARARAELASLEEARSS